MPRNYLFSASQLKDWSRCRRKYQLKHVAKLDWPSDPSNFRVGKAVHKLMEYQAGGLQCDPLAEHTDADIRQAWHQLQRDPVANLPVVASEWGFMVPMAGVWLQGRVDRIARDGDRILVIDWKTGTAIPKMPENDWQTLLYLYAVMEARQELDLPNLTPDQLEFVYVEVKHDSVRHVRVGYSTPKHQAALQRLEQTVKDILQVAKYPLPEKCPDRYCPYSSVCGIQHPTADGNGIALTLA